MSKTTKVFQRVFSLDGFELNLREHAIGLMTAFGVFEFDAVVNEIRLSPSANAVRANLAEKYQLIPFWLSFSSGVELLAKSVCIKHDVLKPEKKNVAGKLFDAKASNFQDAERAFQLARISFIDYSTPNPSTFEMRCAKEKLTHLYDLNIGTLGTVYRDMIPHLQKKGIINEDTSRCLRNALQVLGDMRRNVDAHNFFLLTIGGSINDDVEKLYLPTVNKLLIL